MTEILLYLEKEKEFSSLKSTFSIQEFYLIKLLHSLDPYDEKSLKIWKNSKTEKSRVFHKIVFFVLYTHILIPNQCRSHIYKNSFDWILLSNFINILKKLHTVHCFGGRNDLVTNIIFSKLIGYIPEVFKLTRLFIFYNFCIGLAV